MSRPSPPAVAVLCLVVSLFLPPCEGCAHVEKTALLDILHQFDSHPSPLDWSSRDCCGWDGVTCNSRTGRVTGLDLSLLGDANSRAGRVTGLDLSLLGDARLLLNTTMFLPLQELRNLSLRNLAIQGCVPGAGFEVWSKLRKLEILDLSWNQELDESSIPSLVAVSSLRSLFLIKNTFRSNQTIQQLSTMKLHTLDLHENYLHGTLSTDICNMGDLEELHLNSNSLFGEVPSCMQNLVSLKILELTNNAELIMKFPSPIVANLKSMVKLLLSNIYLEGVLCLSSLQSHSQLTHLILESNNNHFHVQTENPAIYLSAQLQVLTLKNCNLNGKSAVTPSFLLHQHALEELDMSNNSLSGYFPSWLIDNNVNLSRLVLGGNSFVGPFLPSKVHTNFLWLDASYNRLSKLPADINTTFPNLRYLTLSGNYFKGIFPSVFSYMDSLEYLDLSYNNFSDNIGAAFVGSMSNITGLKLSGNRFYGSFPQDIVLPSILHLLLSDNEIKGIFPQKICESPKLMTFDASSNELTGPLPTCIYKLSELAVLILRENSLVGPLPLELCDLRNLVFLDISENNFSGPVHCLPDLYHLHMSKNRLNGTFPIPLSVTTNIYTMDLRENQFTGILPKMIGKSFPKLKVLLLRGNMFEGTVPNDICNLRYLRLLDLSHNKLSGQLPLCLYIMGLDDGLFDFQEDFGTFPVLFNVMGLPDQEEFMTKSRPDSYKGNILNYMSGLDFSSNQLTGSIQESIGDMKWLRALNFSGNYLHESIPNSLSKLSDLESLDLSYNNLTGQIPRELVSLQSLEVFSVAYNDLSGPTPGTTGQFITFDQSSYEGNAYLCGPPLLKSCSTPPSTPQFEEHGEEDDDKVGDIILFGCSAMFYVVGLWTSLGVLYFKTSWRWSWFARVDWFGDFVMVKLSVFTRKIRSTNCTFWRAE